MNKAYLFLFIIIISCNQPSEKENLTIEIKKQLEDYAFKNNQKLKLYDLSILKIDTVTQHAVDSEYLYKAYSSFDHYLKMAELTSEMVKNSQEQAKLYGSIGSKVLFQTAKDEANEYLKKSQKLIDTARYYRKIDSAIREKISSNKKPEKVFRARTFIKATHYSGVDSSNTMDTVYYYFDKNKSFIDISKFKEVVKIN